MAGQMQTSNTWTVTIASTAVEVQGLVELPVASSGFEPGGMCMIGHDPACPNAFTLCRVFVQSNGTP